MASVSRALAASRWTVLAARSASAPGRAGGAPLPRRGVASLAVHVQPSASASVTLGHDSKVVTNSTSTATILTPPPSKSAATPSPTTSAAATPAAPPPPAATTAPTGRRLRARLDPIKLTDSAVERIKFLLAQQPEATGVKLGVRTRGCNGLSYTMDYVKPDDKKKAVDEVVESKGVKVVIDGKALIHLIGTTMDYKEDALSAEFVFENPNAKGACGCGESFNVT